jgi:hypothetical protein
MLHHECACRHAACMMITHLEGQESLVCVYICRALENTSARLHLMCTASAFVSEFIFELAALLSHPVACSQSCILGQTFAYYL